MTGKPRHVRRACGALAILGLTLSLAAPAQAANCARPAEEAAVHVRVLQSDLMVAALTCNSRHHYNAFAKQFQPELVRHGQSLKGFFNRLYGARADEKLNAFVTYLANDASVRSINAGGGYCQQANAVFDAVLGLEPSELGAFSTRRLAASSPPRRIACTASERIVISDE